MSLKDCRIADGSLTDFGRRELWYRYASEYFWLNSSVFVRASSDARVVESGQFFLQGFKGQAYNKIATLPNVNVVSLRLSSTPLLDCAETSRC